MSKNTVKMNFCSYKLLLIKKSHTILPEAQALWNRNAIEFRIDKSCYYHVDSYSYTSAADLNDRLSSG